MRAYRSAGLIVARLLPALMMACALPWRDAERFRAALSETAIATFLGERSDPHVPAGPLEFRGGSLYGSAPERGPDGSRTWQIRDPRVQVVLLPASASDRRAGIEYSADVTVRAEERYCARLSEPDAAWACEPWQELVCCGLLWQRTRAGWRATRP